MTTPQEDKLLQEIQLDLLRELLKEKCTIIQVLQNAVSRAEFSAAKYKDRESYERLLSLKRGFNILKRYIEVSSHEKIDCP